MTGSCDNSISNILRDHLLSKETFTFPLPMHDGSHLSTCSLILLVVWLDDNHPGRYEVVAHYGIDLNSLND